MPQARAPAAGRSGQGLEQQDLLVDAEPVQHQHQALAAAGHLALHGQAEVLLHALGDAPGDRVVPSGAATGRQMDRRLAQPRGPAVPGQNSLPQTQRRASERRTP